jgi:hypothetical protein
VKRGGRAEVAEKVAIRKNFVVCPEGFGAISNFREVAIRKAWLVSSDWSLVNREA